MSSRRRFLAQAASLGAVAAWAKSVAKPSVATVREKRDLFPEGVASGDPDASSVVLWTRRPFSEGSRASLRVEVAEDERFQHVVVSTSTFVLAASDWTCRVLVGNLKPAHVYWFRFLDSENHASRTGRTMTAPAESDTRPVRFAFVSCQNINQGAQNAYRKMIFEDERAAPSQQLGFVLHLGDFVYESVWYPEDRPQGMYGRKVRDILRFPHGEKIDDFHVPRSLDDYRALYRAYLHDPDIQDARARWPFVNIWDNHEFSWSGWQSFQLFGGKSRPAQTLKVAANQAWFEYQPARIAKSSGPDLSAFNAPRVEDAPIREFDQHGLGDEPNNRAALDSLTGYRALRWGAHVDLLITDQRSYRSEAPASRREIDAFVNRDFPELISQELMEILDAGLTAGGGNPPPTLRFGSVEIPNFRRDDAPQTLLGAVQKDWFLQRLRSSRATWKIWGNTLATLDYRIDPQNLPAGLTKPWPTDGYATLRAADYGSAFSERAEIYAAVRDAGITGFATLSGDRHSFWAGLAAPSLPPRPFEPVGIAFVTGAISSTSLVEKLETGLPPDHPLRALYLLRDAATVNMLCRHGVRSCLEYQRSGNIDRARSLSNPALSPHLAFLELDGQGYSIVSANADALECEFVCIQRPHTRATGSDGGPVRFRITHRAALWSKGEAPRLQQRVTEGNPELSI